MDGQAWTLLDLSTRGCVSSAPLKGMALPLDLPLLFWKRVSKFSSSASLKGPADTPEPGCVHTLHKPCDRRVIIQ